MYSMKGTLRFLYAWAALSVGLLWSQTVVAQTPLREAKLALSSFGEGTFENFNNDHTLAERWTSNAIDGQPQVTVSRGNNVHDITVTTDGQLHLMAGLSKTATYTITVSEGYYIGQFAIIGTAIGADFTISGGDAGQKVTFTQGVPNGVTLTYTGQPTAVTFTMTATDNSTSGSINLASSGMGVGEEVRTVSYQVLRSEGDVVAQQDGCLAISGTLPSLPTALRRGFCAYSYEPAVVEDTSTVIRTSYVVTGLPFEFSESADNLNQFYTLGVGKPNRQAFYRYSSVQASAKEQISNGTRSTQKPVTRDHASSFAFVGDPYDLKVYNRLLGKDLPLGVLTGNLESIGATMTDDLGPQPIAPSEGYTSWELFSSNDSASYINSTSPIPGFYLRLKGTTVYTGLDVYCGVVKYSEADEQKLHVSGTGIVTTSTSAQDKGSIRWYAPEKIAVDVTFHVYQHADDAQPTQTVELDIAQNTTPALPAAYKADYTEYKYFASEAAMKAGTPEWTSTEVASGAVVYALATQGTLPFTVSDPDKGDWHWYYLRIRGNVLGDKTDANVPDPTRRWNYINATGPGPYLKTADKPFAPTALWAFVGNTTDGFTIYNRWYGKDYVLTNLYGDEYATEADNSVHDLYKGPVMAKQGEESAHWKLVDSNSTTDGAVFGFTDMANANMSISSHTNKDYVTFYFWNAKQAMNSRFYAEKFVPAETDDLSATVTTLLGLEDGTLFGLTADAKARLQQASTTTEKEAIIMDADSYVRMSDVATDGHLYVRLKNAGTGKYVNIAESDYLYSSSTPTSTPAMTRETASPTDAGQVFGLTFTDGDTTMPAITSQGYALTPGATTGDGWTSGAGTPATLLLNVLAPGRASIAGRQATDYPYLNAMTEQGQAVINGSVADADAAGWIIGPVTSLTAKATRPVKIVSDDSYLNYSFASLCYPFPVAYAGDGTIYICQGRSGNSLTMNPLGTTGTERQIPAGVPFLYKSAEGDYATAPVFTILTAEPAALNNADAFEGLYLSRAYETGFLHDELWVLSYSSTKVITGSNGVKTGWAFRHSANKSYFGPNKGYVNMASPSAETAAKGFAIIFSDEPASTGISSHTVGPVDEAYYDLQGRRVGKPTAAGVYIHRGRKVVISNNQ